MTTPTNHWKLGLFVVVGSLLGLTAVVYLGARTWQKPATEYRSYLDEAVTGLDVGSSVRFRGVTIGSVTDIAIAPDHRHVELRYGIAVDAVEGLNLAQEQPSGQPHTVPAQGLRAQLGSQGVTGVKYVLLDFFDSELNPPPELPFPVPRNYIPSTPSTLKNLEGSVVRAIDQVPVATEQLAVVLTEVKALVTSISHERLPQRVSGTLTRVDSVLSVLDQRLRELPVARLSREASATLANFNGTLTRLQGLLARIDSDRGLMRSVERAADSVGDMASNTRDLTGQLDQTLRDVSEAAAAIRDLAGALDRDPDMLLKGEEQSEDPMTEGASYRGFTRACLASLAFTLASCALTSKSDPWTPRYFTAESLRALRPSEARGQNGEPLRLRLGRITAAEYLRTAIAYRGKAHELSYYDDQRWTEAPNEYLRRALSRKLFEDSGVVRVVSGSAPTLDVELTAFEGVQGPPEVALLEVVVELHDAGIVKLERTVRVERPIAAAGAGDRAAATVTALSQALDDAVREIGARVQAALEPARE